MTCRKTTHDIYRDGRWLQRLIVNGKYTWTTSGVLWNNVKERTTHGSATQLREQSYIGSTNEFISFDDFTLWNKSQVGYALGYELDSDLLSDGIKKYSPNTCLLIPKELNRFLQNNGSGILSIKPFPWGMYESKNKLTVRCSLKLPNEDKLMMSKSFRLDDLDNAKNYYKNCKNNYLQTWITKLKTSMTIDDKVIYCLENMSFDYDTNGMGFSWKYNHD